MSPTGSVSQGHHSQAPGAPEWRASRGGRCGCARQVRQPGARRAGDQSLNPPEQHRARRKGKTVNMLHEVVSQLVRRLPMQNCSTKHLHSREAAKGCRTCGNSCLHRFALTPLLEQTCIGPCPSHCSWRRWAHNLCSFGVTSYCQTEAGVITQM